MRPGLRALVIDDDRYIAQLVAMELEHRGLKGLCVHDGLSGLEAKQVS